MKAQSFVEIEINLKSILRAKITVRKTENFL